MRSLSLIAPVLREIEQGGQGLDLPISAHISFSLRLFERNPGMEAAADDLYAAAVTLVRENMSFSQTSARGRRLLKEAHLRFCSRLEAAADRIRPYEYLVVPDYPVHNAA